MENRKGFLIGCLGIGVGIVLGILIAIGTVSVLGSRAARNPAVEATLLPDQPDVSVTASAAFVNPQMEFAIRQSGFAKQAKVSLASPNLVRIATPVAFNLLGQSIQVDATTTMAIAVQNGRAVLSIQNVDAIGIQVPREVVSSTMEKLRAQGEDQLNRLIQRSLQGTGLRLLNVRVNSDALIVDLSSR